MTERPRARTLAARSGSPVDGEASRVAARAFHMMGPDAEDEWAGDEAMAWEGLLEVARRLRRRAEEMLIESFELSISMLGITGRLSRAPEPTLRQTALADAMGLSLSRVSRVIDLLEQRGLVERRACPTDARATNVTLTRQGGALTASAQRELFAFVRSAFFDALEPGEVETLAAVFMRLLNGPRLT
jgi:DNA-binding MarR family transcriptional regulator